MPSLGASCAAPALDERKNVLVANLRGGNLKQLSQTSRKGGHRSLGGFCTDASPDTLLLPRPTADIPLPPCAINDK